MSGNTIVTVGNVLLVGASSACGAIENIASRNTWNLSTVSTALQAGKKLRGDHEIDLVIFASAGELDEDIAACRNIKFDQRSHRIPVIFLLADEHASRSAEILDCGADDCVMLGASDREISLRLRNAIRMKQATDSMENAEVMILSLARAIEGKDAYTCGHVERVGSYSEAIGRRLQVTEAQLIALRTGGIVHDIGKVGIPDQILNKPGKLTDEEFAIIKRHPVIGHDILKPMRTFADVLPIVRWHHEKPNGKGYPDGLTGDKIPLIARIAAVADWFDALTTDRSYRKAFSPAEAAKMLQDGGQKGDLDPQVVAAMCEITSGSAQLANPSSASAQAA